VTLRAWLRERSPAPPPRLLARIESAVDSISVEVERVAEAQRFLTKLQTERQPLSRGDNPGTR